jgi:hypothetical protein
MKCINCTKFIQCSLDKQADENKKECIYFIHRDKAIEELKERAREFNKKQVEIIKWRKEHLNKVREQVRRMLEDE